MMRGGISLLTLAACLAVTNALAASNEPAPSTITQSPTGYFWTNSNAARVQKFNDRFFVGGATANNGQCCATNADWLSQLSNVSYNGGPGVAANGNASQAYILTGPSTDHQLAGAGLTIGTQTAGQTTTSTTVLALEAVAVNNHPSLAMQIWSVYTEAHNVSTFGEETTNAELEIRDSVSSQLHDPFNNFYIHHQSSDLQLGCGAGLSATGQFDCGYALGIFPNTLPFNAGILFKTGSIASTTGFNSGAITVTPAVGFADAMEEDWFSATATVAGRMTFDLNGHLFLNAVADAVTLQTANSGLGINGNTNIGFPGVGKVVAVSDPSSAAFDIVLNGTGAAEFASGTTFTYIADTRSGSNITMNSPALNFQTGGTPALSINSSQLISLPAIATGTPVAGLCLNASNEIIKKTTTGSCV